MTIINEIPVLWTIIMLWMTLVGLLTNVIEHAAPVLKRSITAQVLLLGRLSSCLIVLSLVTLADLSGGLDEVPVLLLLMMFVNLAVILSSAYLSLPFIINGSVNRIYNMIEMGAAIYAILVIITMLA